MSADRLAAFDRPNYIALETFRKNGQGVQTPVWFVRHDDVLYVYTEADSGKIKRLRHTSRVRIAVCDVRGRVRGPWLDAAGVIVEGEEQRTADRLLDRKYFLKRLFNVLTRPFPRHARAMIRIVPA